MAAEKYCTCDGSGDLCPACNAAAEEADRTGKLPVFPPPVPAPAKRSWDHWAETHEFDIQCD